MQAIVSQKLAIFTAIPVNKPNFARNQRHKRYIKRYAFLKIAKHYANVLSFKTNNHPLELKMKLFNMFIKLILYKTKWCNSTWLSY